MPEAHDCRTGLAAQSIVAGDASPVRETHHDGSVHRESPSRGRPKSLVGRCHPIPATYHKVVRYAKVNAGGRKGGGSGSTPSTSITSRSCRSARVKVSPGDRRPSSSAEVVQNSRGRRRRRAGGSRDDAISQSPVTVYHRWKTKPRVHRKCEWAVRKRRGRCRQPSNGRQCRRLAVAESAETLTLVSQSPVHVRQMTPSV